ncbi:MAG: cytochrome c oxidase subunit II [Euryarchaeota archaeon]|jgi:cytochrome c oxidase subunit 2|nr:cytochrome c oxidase subunit II [Euryarchaeota archaeon]MDP6363524.1 cytochrome c oxidase subunit II [Candidatus Poseidoniia archaeon]MDP6658554.1 cytochrome c oxidase subunit II [Candidatus Poseidoniia archaeon]MDP6846877.1 cytochrome c oxidase subunit II [Candidatus Poseidoniia archaeon]MDP7007085.1 cytochrome c oxidase subunit II [Candidatus Poseidoniia archaeon]|tara:strand:+ start:5194 stop:5940 length:747 start_codon:yes stop_codon:yes gene_type:complete
MRRITLAIASALGVIILLAGEVTACASCVSTGTTGVHAEKYDRLFSIYTLIGGIVTLVVYGWMGWLLFKFRAKEGDFEPADAPKLGEIPKHRGDPAWTWAVTAGIFVILMGLTIGTIDMVNFYENPDEGMASRQVTVKVTGAQYFWEFEYPSGNKSYDTLTVPTDTTVILEVTSDDVWHNFAVPALRLKIDAIPGDTEPNVIWFDASNTGEYPIYCMELCGADHADMKGTLVIVEPDDYTNLYDGGSA